jgi:hypothetical protein
MYASDVRRSLRVIVAYAARETRRTAGGHRCPAQNSRVASAPGDTDGPLRCSMASARLSSTAGICGGARSRLVSAGPLSAEPARECRGVACSRVD